MKRNKIIHTHIILLCFLLLFPGILFSAECIDSKGLSYSELDVDQPSDISVGPEGDIYLVDGVNNRIVVLDREGRQKFTFGTSGSSQGEFKYPMGIDVSKDGKVFVADTGNHRIQAFSSRGQFLYMFDVETAPDEKPADPVDVLASNLREYLYISDNDNHRIRVYKQNGDFQFEWGKFGEGPGEFRYPGILASNAYNEVFVVDVLNTRVQKFDPFGNFIAEIGSWGVSPGNLFRPKGVAVDKESRVFVTDSYMGLIQVFTDLGRFLGVVCENNEKRQFVTPVGVTSDEENRLHLVEMRANKVSVLKLLE